MKLSLPTVVPLVTTAHEAITRSCEEPGVRCVALDPAPDGNTRQALQADGHWGALANRRIADTLASALTQEPRAERAIP